MAKKNLNDAELDEINKQMRSLRKKLQKLKRTTIAEVRKPLVVAITKTQVLTESKKNGEYKKESRGDEPSLKGGYIARSKKKSHNNDPSLKEGHIVRSEISRQ